jgi:creatinine amidohydrolase
MGDIGGANSAVLLSEMTWPEVAAAAEENRPVVLILGSTEQHGPHLPLGTDVLIPLAIALRVSREVPIVIAPPVPYGARSRPRTGGGEGFPGTLSLSAATFVSLAREAIAALARSGFRRILVYAFHFENEGPAAEACHLAHERDPSLRVVLHSVGDIDFGEDDINRIFEGTKFEGWDVEHAAHAETSLMLALAPDLVRVGKIVDESAPLRLGWESFPPVPATIPPSGALARAQSANARAGELLSERICTGLKRTLEEAWSDRT